MSKDLKVDVRELPKWKLGGKTSLAGGGEDWERTLVRWNDTEQST